jgi:hypothetical protein
MDKKKVRVVEYSNRPEMEGDELQVIIIDNENIKPRMKSKIAPRKPKQPSMTIMQLAIEMRAGFARVNTEIAAVNQKIDKIEDVLKRNNLK